MDTYLEGDQLVSAARVGGEEDMYMTVCCKHDTFSETAPNLLPTFQSFNPAQAPNHGVAAPIWNTITYGSPWNDKDNSPLYITPQTGCQ